MCRVRGRGVHVCGVRGRGKVRGEGRDMWSEELCIE